MTSRDPDIALSPSRRRALPGLLIAGAGVLGACGVGLSAAAAHRDGGQLATTAGLFCLLHAAAVLALARPAQPAGAGLSRAAALMLLFGTALFSGDLALAGLAAARPLPAMAPVGGSVMILGWILVVVAGCREAARRP